MQSNATLFFTDIYGSETYEAQEMGLFSLINEGRELIIVYRRKEEGMLRLTSQGSLSVEIYLSSKSSSEGDKERRNEAIERMCERVSDIPFA
jgi:hypothetical protein